MKALRQSNCKRTLIPMMMMQILPLEVRGVRMMLDPLIIHERRISILNEVAIETTEHLLARIRLLIA